MERGFTFALTLEIAQDDRKAILARQTFDLFFQDRPETLSVGFGRSASRGNLLERWVVSLAAAGVVGASAQGYSAGNAVKPVGELFRPANRAGFANEDEKS